MKVISKIEYFSRSKVMVLYRASVLGASPTVFIISARTSQNSESNFQF